MKKLILCVVWVLSMLGAFVTGRLSYALRGGLFPPEYASDQGVRKKIEDMGITIPSSADHLTYLRVGFEEPSVYIAMDVSAADRESVMARWLESDQSKWSTVPVGETSNYAPAALHLRSVDVSRFAFVASPNAAGYRFSDDPTQEEKAVIYEERGRRLLLYYWHE